MSSTGSGSGGGEFKLEGVEQLMRELEGYPDRIKRKAADQGVKKATQFMNRKFRAAAPKESGRLRKSINWRFSKRYGVGWAGLTEYFFYKRLEWKYPSGGAFRPFFEKTWDANKEKAAQMMVDEMRKALYYETGKLAAKTKLRR